MAPDCWEDIAESSCVGNMNIANPILHVRLGACLVVLSACAVLPASAICTGHRALGIGAFGPTIHVVVGSVSPQPILMLFDTGAAITVIDRQKVNLANLRFLQDANVSGGTADRSVGKIYLSEFVSPSSGDSVEQPVLVMDLVSKGGPFNAGVHGVFSPRTLGDSPISINFFDKTMCVLKERPHESGIPFINGADGHPAVAVAVDNTEFLAVIDSGSPDLLTLTTEWIDIFDFIEPPKQSGHAMTVAGVNDSLTGRIDGTITVAGVEFENPELTFVVGQAQPLLGMKGLANFEIILDYEVAQSWTNAIDVSGRQIKSAETE